MIERILELVKKGYSVEFEPSKWAPTMDVTIGKDKFYAKCEIPFEDFDRTTSKNMVLSRVIDELVRRCES